MKVKAKACGLDCLGLTAAQLTVALSGWGRCDMPTRSMNPNATNATVIGGVRSKTENFLMLAFWEKNVMFLHFVFVFKERPFFFFFNLRPFLLCLLLVPNLLWRAYSDLTYSRSHSAFPQNARRQH